MLTVIGISGKAGAGKNTLADYMKEVIAKNYTDEVYEVSFAGPLKEYGKIYFGEICDPVVKDPVSRKVLQGIGQMMRSEVSDNFWIEKTVDKINQLYRERSNKHVVVFITDVRYTNEADALTTGHTFNTLRHRENRYLIRLEGRTSLEGKSAQHSSEVDLDTYDNFTETYKNEGTLEDLFAFGDSFIERNL